MLEKDGEQDGASDLFRPTLLATGVRRCRIRHCSAHHQTLPSSIQTQPVPAKGKGFHKSGAELSTEASTNKLALTSRPPHPRTQVTAQRLPSKVTAQGKTSASLKGSSSGRAWSKESCREELRHSGGRTHTEEGRHRLSHTSPTQPVPRPLTGVSSPPSPSPRPGGKGSKMQTISQQTGIRPLNLPQGFPHQTPALLPRPRCRPQSGSHPTEGAPPPPALSEPQGPRAISYPEDQLFGPMGLRPPQDSRVSPRRGRQYCASYPPSLPPSEPLPPPMGPSLPHEPLLSPERPPPPR